MADTLAVALGYDTGVTDYITRPAPSAVRQLTLSRLDASLIQERIAGQVEEMKIVMGLYDARRKADPTSSLGSSARTVVYAAPGNMPLDVISTWLAYQDIEVQSPEALADCAAAPDEPLLLNLWGRAPTEALAADCLGIPASQCMIICTRDWTELLSGRLPDGWRCATDYVGIPCLRTFLQLPDPVADKLQARPKAEVSV